MFQLEPLFLLALVITILLESAVILAVWILGLFKAKPAWTLENALVAGALPSALTLPYLWFILPAFVAESAYVVIGEGLVVLAEAAMLARILRLDIPRALVLSLACNAVSYFLGGMLLAALYSQT